MIVRTHVLCIRGENVPEDIVQGGRPDFILLSDVVYYEDVSVEGELVRSHSHVLVFCHASRTPKICHPSTHFWWPSE
jgi:hypothetical protein